VTESLLVASGSPIRRSDLIPRSIDNTALDAYMTCPKKFEYAYLLNRRGDGTTPALSYGSAWHKAMEAHYKTNGDESAVRRAVIMGWQPHDRTDDHRTVERVLTEYGNYVKRYGLPDVEARDYGTTVGYPDAPLVEISTEAAWPEALHPYAGKIDRIIEWHGLFFVEDHKTTSAMGPKFFQQFDPNNQMMGYAWLAQLLTGLPIAGVRINAHAVLKTQSKFEREVVSFAQERLKDWGNNYNYWVRRMETDIKANDFGHDFNACAGKYGMCPYVPVCTMSPHYRMKVLEKDYPINVWNPMEGADVDE
jgi:hypothetical protein